MKVTNSAGHFCSVKFGTVLRKVSLTLKVEEKLSKEAKTATWTISYQNSVLSFIWFTGFLNMVGYFNEKFPGAVQLNINDMLG